MSGDAPTIGERYSSATESSNLRAHPDRPGDVDLMIASGWIADGLATSLYRLRSEFDAVKAEHERIEPELQRQIELARMAEKDERLGIEVGKAIRQQAKTDALTARLFVLMHLKSLSPCVQRVGNFALAQAARKGLRESVDTGKIAGRVLDVLLDPNCHHCDGRGFNGGTHRGEPQVLCKPCRGSGHRRDTVGKTDRERAFAMHLLAQLESVLSDVDRKMRAFLRGRIQAVRIDSAGAAPPQSAPS